MVTRRVSFLYWCSLLLTWGSTPLRASKFKFVNKCGHTVWPGILSNAGSSPLPTTGFELPSGSSRAIQAPSGWSGRFWGRTGCSLGANNLFSCSTGDCGSGQVECNGGNAAPPATLAEFTLGGDGGKDFYDVSLVDGYNLPMVVEVSGGGGSGCPSTGCAADLNRACPAELKVVGGDACRSACEAFGKPEYCCSGAFANPNTCRPSSYSVMFKMACPRSYSYAYDDASSTFTCVAADYAITFCPSSGPSLKSSSTDTKPTTPDSNSKNPPQTTTAAAATMADNDAWLASLASGDAVTSVERMRPFLRTSGVATATSIMLGFFL